MDLMDDELRRVLAGGVEPQGRMETEIENEMRRLRMRDASRAPSASELETASRPAFRMSSAGGRRPETQRGGGEAIDTLMSGFAGSIPAGLAGAGNLLAFQGPQKAAEAVERVQDYLTIEPQTEGGVRAFRGIAGALSPMGAPAQYLGDATLRATGSPLAATAAEVLLDPLNLMGTAALAKAAPRAAAAAGRGAAKAGKATVESLGPKAAEMAEAYMRRAGMMPEITTYQGSPHVFASEVGAPLGRLSAEKIGTGEGGAMFGHGHYLAEVPEVAKRYAQDLSNRDISNQNRLTPHANAQRLAKIAGDDKYAADDIRFVLETNPDHPQKKLLQDTLQFLESGEYKKPLAVQGNLYTVDLPDPIVNKMLDWDAPLSEQSESVQKMLSALAERDAKKYGEGGGLDYYAKDPDSYSGESLYKYLSEEEGGQKQASAFLQSQGVPGVRYFDEFSRNAGEGTRNYVVFPGEEKNLTILQRNEQRLPKTDTPAFKEFTGGAPLVKAENATKHEFQTGNPVVIEGYHGTLRDYSEVDPAKSSAGYFTTSRPSLADEYAGVYPDTDLTGGSSRMLIGGNVQRQYVRMDNPLVINARGANWSRIDTRGVPGYPLPMSNTDAINQWAKQSGYDGVIYKDLRDSMSAPSGRNAPVSNVYASFKPNYVKSAIGNRGTFDVRQNDMTKAQGGPVESNMSYTGAADIIADKLVRQGMDADKAFSTALRMSEANMKAGGAVLMAAGGQAAEDAAMSATRSRMDARWSAENSRPSFVSQYMGPNPNRQVINGRAVVSREELADFQRKFGADKTLRDLLNADRTGVLPQRPAELDPLARGPQGVNVAPVGPRRRPDEAAIQPSVGLSDIPGLIMQGMKQGAERVPFGRGAGAAFVGAGMPRAAAQALMGPKLLRENPAISPERQQALKEMEDYISGLNRANAQPMKPRMRALEERIDPPNFRVGGKVAPGIASGERAATRVAERLAAKKVAEEAERAAAQRASAGQKAADVVKATTPVKMSEALGNLNTEGKGQLRVTQSDRTRVGGGNIGGALFPKLQRVDPAYGDVGAVWGVGKKGTASALINQSTPETYWSTLLGAEDQLKSNPIVFDRLFDTFLQEAKSGKLDNELRGKINQRLEPMFGEGVDVLDPKLRNKINTFQERAAVADLLLGKQIGGEQRGGSIIPGTEILRQETEPMLRHPAHGGDVPTFAVGPRLFQLSGDVVNRPDLHPGFPVILTGKDTGELFQPAPGEVAMRDFAQRMKSQRNRKPGYYEWTMGEKGSGLPSQQITEDYLTYLQKAGYADGGVVDDRIDHPAFAKGGKVAPGISAGERAAARTAQRLAANKAAAEAAKAPAVATPAAAKRPPAGKRLKTAFAVEPHEYIPGAGVRLGESMVDAPLGAREQYSSSISSLFQDPMGRDLLQSAVGLNPLPTRAGTGAFRPSGDVPYQGNVKNKATGQRMPVESQPAFSSGAEVPVIRGGLDIGQKAKDRLGAAAAMRGYMTGQHGSTYNVHIPREGGDSFMVKMEGKADPDPMRYTYQLLDDAGYLADTGAGVNVLMNKYKPGNVPFIPQEAKNITELLGGQGYVPGVNVSDYIDYSPAWMGREGSGAATKELLSRLDPLNKAEKAALSKETQGIAGGLYDLFTRKSEKTGDEYRLDVMRALQILRDKGVPGLAAALAAGEALPSEQSGGR